MSAIDQEMWQDFVVEAEENMQELEPNLLLLEQDPENTSLLNDCFRNMHSIKGAANYMGLVNTATLAHRMESLFDHVRQGKVNLDENAMNVLFDGLDRVKQLVKEVAENREEKSQIDDIVSQIEDIIEGRVQAEAEDVDYASAQGTQSMDDAAAASEPDDDAELLAIFTEELRSRVKQLEKLDTPVEAGVIKKIVADMVRVTNYIGIEELLSGLEKVSQGLADTHSGDDSLVEKPELTELLSEINTLLARYLGEEFSADEPVQAEDYVLAGEEDEELYRIFLEFVQAEGAPLANIPEKPDAEWLEACRSAVEKLAASAHYMDYQDVVALFEEWNERLVESLSSVSEDKPFNGEPLRRLWARFCTMLPGLEDYLEAAGPFDFGEDSADISGADISGQEDNEQGEILDALDSMDDMFGIDSGEALAQEASPAGAEAVQGVQGEEVQGAELSGTEPDAGEESADGFHELDSALDNMFSDQQMDQAAASAVTSGAEELTVDEPSGAAVPEDEAEVSEEAQQKQEPVADAFQSQGASGPAPYSGPAMGGVPPVSPPGPTDVPESPFARRSEGGASKLVRVDLAKVEALLEDVGELVVLRAAMMQIADDMKELYGQWLEERRLTNTELKPMKQIMIRTAEQTATLEKVVHQLQDSVMKMRMLPVGTLFKRYPRMIRDLSAKLGKKVELRVYGEGTALDKRVIEQITDPLQHIVRNCVDHGIEAPEIRERQGKPSTGVITLSAGQEGNFVVITISDDGRGLDREAIIQKAVQNGIINGETARTMSDERVWNMVFLPGISTASSVSDTSGRGVGMDVVKNNIERLGGQISITSSPGRGTSLTLRIPLTLAIIQALLVRVGEQNMAIPLTAVQETFRIYEDDVSSIEGFEIISLRQETLPLIRLGSVFRGTGAETNPEKLFVVRVKMHDIEAGLAVDRFIGQQEVVIKPLSEYLTDEPGFSGATILGDGTVALILDIPAVLERARNFTLKRQQIMEQAALGLSTGESPPLFH